jgi:hypothetical protein
MKIKKAQQTDNTITLTLPNDIQKITEAARESYYYLKNIGEFYKDEVSLPENYDSYMYEEGGKKITMLQEEFILLENRLYENYSAALGTKLKYNKDLIATVVDYLMLKERMDNLQLATLQFLYSNKNALIDELVKDNEKLAEISKLHTHKIQLTEAFDHSMDADKFVDYKIQFSISKWEKKYSKKNVYPIIIRIIDHDYLLKRQRKQIAKQQETQTKLIKHLASKEQNENIEKLVDSNSLIHKFLRRMNNNILVLGVSGIVFIAVLLFLFLSGLIKL